MKRKFPYDVGGRKKPKLVHATSSLSPTSSRRSSVSDILVDAQVAGTAAGYAGLAAGGPVVGDVAAAVGTIAGGLYGALKVFGTSSKKNMGMKRNILALNDKTAMSTSGKAKVKHVKRVKVSPYLKKAVKQVMQGAAASGLYRRSFSGMVGNVPNVSAAGFDGTLVTTVYGVAGTVGAYLPGTGKPNNQKTWWGCLGRTRETLNAELIPNTDLNFFTPAKILHYASVLFNNKGDRDDPYFTNTDNLSTTFLQDTGLPVNVANNLKIDVKSSSVLLTMRNMSGRVQFVEIYEMVSTTKFQNKPPINDLIELGQSVQDGTDPGETNNILGYYSGGTKYDKETRNFITEGSVDAVSVLKNHGLKWKYKKHTMAMAPGEMCTHTVKGPSGILDFQKLWNPETDSLNVLGAVKDWSKHLMISVRPDFALQGGSTFNAGQRWVRQSTVNPNLASGVISIEAVETVSIVVPEIAGFVGQLGGLGATKGQPLNQRKNRIVLNNITPSAGNNDVALFVYAAEQNPIAQNGSNVLM